MRLNKWTICAFSTVQCRAALMAQETAVLARTAGSAVSGSGRVGVEVVNNVSTDTVEEKEVVVVVVAARGLGQEYGKKDVRWWKSHLFEE